MLYEGVKVGGHLPRSLQAFAFAFTNQKRTYMTLGA